jgi:hypothetical protein
MGLAAAALPGDQVSPEGCPWRGVATASAVVRRCRSFSTDAILARQCLFLTPRVIRGELTRSDASTVDCGWLAAVKGSAAFPASPCAVGHWISEDRRLWSPAVVLPRHALLGRCHDLDCRGLLAVLACTPSVHAQCYRQPPRDAAAPWPAAARDRPPRRQPGPRVLSQQELDELSGPRAASVRGRRSRSGDHCALRCGSTLLSLMRSALQPAIAGAGVATLPATQVAGRLGLTRPMRRLWAAMAVSRASPTDTYPAPRILQLIAPAQGSDGIPAHRLSRSDSESLRPRVAARATGSTSSRARQRLSASR